MTTAAVIGSGPNGLAAAITLAAAGVSVTVYEAADRVGGGARSAELTLPGLIHDECSSHHPFGLAAEFSRTFDLAAHGLEWAFTEVEFSHPLDGGRGAAALRSVVETSRTLGSDARTYRRFFSPVASRMPTVADEFLQSLIHIPRHPLHLATLGMRASLPAAAVARLFRTEEAKALWSGVAAHTFGPFDMPLSAAIGTSLASAAHYFGWPVAVGGSGAITEAMASLLDHLGGRIVTGRRIDDVRDLGGVDVLMLDTGPAEAERIAGSQLGGWARTTLGRWQNGPAAFKVALAVEGGIPWSHEASRRSGTVHLGGTYEEVAAAEKDVAKGRMPERPYALLAQQHLADPSRGQGSVVPIDVYAHVPQGFDGDATEAILSQIERFAPGTQDRILAVTPRGTSEIEALNANFVGGDILTGRKDPLQLVFGPGPGFDPYRLSARRDDGGIYLCSAAVPPGPGAHGMCGFLAARRAIADLGGNAALTHLDGNRGRAGFDGNAAAAEDVAAADSPAQLTNE
ncbi:MULTISPECIES: phytoene desaturase family protein [unclassified Brevibacterium]|jgi:phytoene dehydrogenase-like protein|uniref:phytoene desaturase family protein n=1 Tax=unclassified Brevibacterium TaxID=2614124 RepID=UPI00109334AC|nr:NAD(P)/FAD-dependent oxidoreductase [Brevibacterium sp. S22]TGD30168.1 NAD(P)/FAD-dependent oxidoreductase [Brevibacterium sp. S22]